MEAAYGGKKCPALSESLACNAAACPVDCEVSRFAPWGKCTKSCGTGEQSRSRQIAKDPANGGKVCPHLEETQKCMLHACPVDCVVSEYGNWGACDKSCGTGSQTRTRAVISEAKFGGALCPAALADKRSCNAQACPVDCVASQWADWAECSASCSAGSQTRSRSILSDAANGGKRCTELTQNKYCNEGPCPIHCSVSSWSAFTTCSKTCGKGTHSRARSVVAHAQHGGFLCPQLTESANCNEQSCPVDCVLTGFSSWGSCTKSCGSGTQIRTRNVFRAAQFGGVACGALKGTCTCNDQACPVDCRVGEWGEWSQCSKTCGSGSQTRLRALVQPSNGGVKCPSNYASRTCSTSPCPVNCLQSGWNSWSSCTKTCGSGSQTRSRSVLVAADYGGRACSLSSQTLSCNTQECPINCVVTNFNAWTACSMSCGTGFQNRQRSIVNANAHGGIACPKMSQSQWCNTHPCPVDCKVSAWGTFGSCSKTCGTGSQTRRRSVDTAVAYGGKPCPELSSARDCNTQACPVDCEMSKWSAWTVCSATCATGTQSKIRSVVTAAAHGGVACSHDNTNYQTCKEGPCPIHCEVSAWSTWSECSTTCGSGSQARSRTVTTHAQHGGYTCPTLSASQTCNTNACPVDCAVSSFGTWASCSKTCGSGSQSRSRSVVTSAAFGGKVCPGFTQAQPCNTQSCPIDCVYTYSSWSACSQSCGTGSQSRTRQTEVEAAYGGVQCPPWTQTQVCNAQACPIDCVVSTFSDWSTCSKTCGAGSQSRTRTITRANAFGGKLCAPLSEARKCNTLHCPIDCQIGAWTDYGSCSASCGTGRAQRSRSLTQPKFGGVECPAAISYKACNTHTCPVDCVLSAWSAWGQCSKTCGAGFQLRSRSIDVHPSNGGKACAAREEPQKCNVGPCPVHCQSSLWSDWGACSLTCGSGSRSRSRSVIAHAQHGGYVCPTLTSSTACNTQHCAVDCQVSAYNAWSACTHTCNTGTQFRSRSVTVAAAHGGRSCPSISQYQTCAHQACPVDCEVTMFGSYSACTKSCGGGTQERTRDVQTEVLYGGAKCPPLKESRPCNTDQCPVDCTVSAWTDWSECSVSCASGTQTRSRSVVSAAQHGGKPCSNFGQKQYCNNGPCPIHCTVTSWSTYTSCSKSCGKGFHSRTRSVVQHANHGGYVCPNLTEKHGCNEHSCPVDCVLTGFDSWSTCSKTCGSGSQTRSRTIYRNVAFGGAKCGALSQTRACNTQLCPVDCVQTSWSEWTTCSVSCNGGEQIRSRKISTAPTSGGKSCGASSEKQNCNIQICPVNCVVSGYGAWAICSKTCGGGNQDRTRSVMTAPSSGGRTCPALTESRACGIGPCPVHCAVSDWSTFTTCSKTCGKGAQKRTRTVTEHAAHGGYVCPDLVEVRACNESPCPIDCVMSAWTAWSSCTRSCGSGSMKRLRSIVTSVAHGGVKCPSHVQTSVCSEQTCPVDCEVGAFTEWSACTKSCNTGSQSRTRVVTRDQAHGGKPCPNLKATTSCSTNACPVDCTVSAWTPWGDCSFSCGAGGKQTRSRTVTLPAAHGGESCPNLSSAMPCNDGPCPVHCTVSAFSRWGACSKSCGTGSQSRARSIVTHASHGGFICPSLAEEQVCNTRACPIDCVVSAWSAYGACSKSCNTGTGAGTQQQTRTISTDVAHGGKRCPSLTNTRQCNAVNCPVDCKVSPWTSYGACSNSCGGGSQTKSRRVATTAQFGGVGCPGLSRRRSCNSQACPANCVQTAWSDWSSCTTTCGTGTWTATRSVVTAASNGGVACGESKKAGRCTMGPCPVHCSVSDWSSYSSCTKSCGVGTHSRTRSVVVHANHGGYICPELTSTTACNIHACPVDCAVEAWGAWSECTKSCGTGSQWHSRGVVVATRFGGKPCPALRVSRTCNAQACPINCEVTGWGSYGACSKTCGSGVHTRSRSISRQAGFGGAQCPSLTSSASCMDMACVDCRTSLWTGYSACSKTCGGGVFSRSRSVIAQAIGGKPCPSNLEETGECNTNACGTEQHGTFEFELTLPDSPGSKVVLEQIRKWLLDSGAVTVQYSRTVAASRRLVGGSAVAYTFAGRFASGADLANLLALIDSLVETIKNEFDVDAAVAGLGSNKCLVSEFSEWSICSENCGGGVSQRTRVIKDSVDGLGCPALKGEKNCNAHPCPVDCEHTWSAWSDCSKSCGSGIQSRSAQVAVHANNGGDECPASQERVCNAQACPVDCVLSGWSAWGACSASCATGSRKRTKSIVVAPEFGGVSCGHDGQIGTCNEQACPVDCVLSTFGAFGSCDKSCGTGKAIATRTIVTNVAYGGKGCASLTTSRRCNTQACPLDCKVSTWSAFGACTKSCGMGYQKRTRSVVIAAQEGGVACVSLTNTASCNLQACPVDCQMEAWGPWSVCKKTCGTGAQSSFRGVAVPAAFGGKACTTKVQTRACNTFSCPVDCVVSNYNSWSACSKTCGNGIQSRSRSVVTQVRLGGKLCPSEMTQAQSCTDGACPVHCFVSAFTKWSDCSKSCGSGTQARSRSVLVHPQYGGYTCPLLDEQQTCNTEACPIDCVVSGYSAWGACSLTCGGGRQTRTSSVITAAAHGGKACPAQLLGRACNVDPCPIDCLVSEFSQWSACSKSCNGGVQSKRRSITQPVAYGGKVCPSLQVSRDCNIQDCPVNCALSQWNSWSKCSQSCGTGTSGRGRSIVTASAYGGIKCAVLSESKNCNVHLCPVDCVVSAFGSYDQCSKTCGTGSQTKRRSIDVPAAYGGKGCASLSATRDCNTQACPVDCALSNWSAWSACSATCGFGTQHSSKSVLTAAAHGGAVCDFNKKTQNCNEGPCPIHCEVSSFTAWTRCSKTCGSGAQSRTRTVTTHAKHGGYVCPALAETQSCNDDACAVDCKVSAFSAWGTCSKTCGTGSQSRSRSVITSFAFGGQRCPGLTQAQPCNVQSCPVDCVVTAFSKWAACSRSCGTGYQSRTRSIRVAAAYGGVQCPALRQTQACNSHNCPENCVMTGWSNWGTCSHSCGVGEHKRTRSVGSPARYGGRSCPPSSEDRACNFHACPIDCKVSRYGIWTACTKSCGTGFQSRGRTIDIPAQYGGKQCPLLSQTRACNTHACPVNCVVSSWGRWGSCTKSCGGGRRTRSRSVVVAAVYGGKACPGRVSSGSCNGHPCPLNCVVSQWSDWGSCSVTCHAGTQQRSRTITAHEAYGGVSCPVLSQTQACQRGPCPIHCKVSAWTSWSACTKSCGTGTHARARKIVTHAQHGGFVCPVLNEERHCNEHFCPVDCVVSPWTSFGACTTSCGTGKQTRTRQIVEAAKYGGACLPLSNDRACNEQPCPVNCVVSEWTKWSECSRRCEGDRGGGGISTRSRSILAPAAHGGSCPQLDATRECNRHKCDCSHIWCEAMEHEVYGKYAIRVHHDPNEQFGSKHVCKILDGQCRCKCHSGPFYWKPETWMQKKDWGSANPEGYKHTPTESYVHAEKRADYDDANNLRYHPDRLA